MVGRESVRIVRVDVILSLNRQPLSTMISRGRQMNRSVLSEARPGEEIRFICQRHWFALAVGMRAPLIMVLLAELGLVAAPIVFASIPLLSTWLVASFWLLFSLGVLWGTWRFLGWKNDLLILTTQRTIQLRRVPLLPEQWIEIPLEQIRSVSLPRISLLGGLIDFGDLTIEPRGGGTPIEAKRVPYPTATQTALLGLIIEERERTASRRVKVSDSHAQQVQDYGFRNLMEHFYGAGQVDKLYELIEDRRWYEAKLAFDPSREAFADDVEIALRAAESQGVEALPRLIAYSLLRASLGALADHAPIGAIAVLAQTAESNLAIRYCATMTDLWKQVRAYSTVARGVWKRGEFQLARSLLRQAVLAAERQIDPGYRAWGFALIAKTFADMDELAQASLLVNRAWETHEYLRTWRWGGEALVQIVEVFAALGDFKHALAATDHIEKRLREGKIQATWGPVLFLYFWWRDLVQALSMISEALFTHDRVEQARSVAYRALRVWLDSEISWNGTVDERSGIQFVVQSLASARHVEGLRLLRATTSRFSSRELKDWAEAHIALALEEMGFADEVTHMVESMLATCASLFPPAGHSDRPQERRLLDFLYWGLAKARGGDVPSRWSFAATVAEVLSLLDRTTDAQEVLSNGLYLAKIQRSDETKATAIKHLARGMKSISWHEELKRCLGTAQALRDTAVRTDYLSDLAEILLEAEMTSEALQTAKAALTCADRIPYDSGSSYVPSDGASPRDWGLMCLTRALARSGNVSGSLDAVRAIHSRSQRLQVLTPRWWENFSSSYFYYSYTVKPASRAASVALSYARRGKLQSALRAATELDSSVDRTFALARIAAVFERRGMYDAKRIFIDLALAEVRQVDEVEDRRDYAFYRLLRALAMHGMGEEVYRLAEEALVAAERTLDEYYDRHRSLKRIAGVLAQVRPPDRESYYRLARAGFRIARNRNRDAVWQHLAVFSPHLPALGREYALKTWQRIQAVEALLWETPAGNQ